MMNASIPIKATSHDRNDIKTDFCWSAQPRLKSSILRYNRPAKENLFSQLMLEFEARST